MTKIVSFPNQEEQALRLAKKALAEKNYLKARTILATLYQTAPSFEINRIYVEVLVLSGDEELAMLTADEMEMEYLSSAEGVRQYFQLLVLNHRFIQAHILLKSGREHPYFIEEQKMLELFEQVYAQSHAYVFETKSQQFATFKENPATPYAKQWESWLLGLTKAQLMTLVIPELATQQRGLLHPRCCELLVKLGEKQTHQVCHPLTNKLENVSFSTLQLLEKSVAYEELERLLTEQYSDQPVIYEWLFAEITGHWAMLFPFLPEKEEISSWVTAYAIDYSESVKSVADTQQTQFQIIIQQKNQLRKNYMEIYQDF